MKNSLIVIFTFFLLLYFAVNGFNYNTNTIETRLNVMCAAGLYKPMHEIKEKFEAENPNISLEVNFSGSQILASQIKQGAYSDIYISANKEYMIDLLQNDYVINPKTFTHNAIAIAVNKESKHIKTLADLANQNVRISMGNDKVPVGKYSLELLSNLNSSNISDHYQSKVLNNVISKELTVRDVVSKLLLGEVDAAFVYKSDVISNNLDTLSINKSDNVQATFQTSTLKCSRYRKTSERFIDFLSSKASQDILSKYGFY